MSYTCSSYVLPSEYIDQFLVISSENCCTRRMWFLYLFVSGILNLFVLSFAANAVRIPLFMTPLKALPQPRDVTSYYVAQQNEFFSRVTTWDVWQASNLSVSEIYNNTVLYIIENASSLYNSHKLKTSQLHVYMCGPYCYALNISDIELYSGYSRAKLNGQTMPAITLGHLHEVVVTTLEHHFCFTMSFVEKELGISSFNITLPRWKLFLPQIAWYAIQCRADILAVSRAELSELVRSNEATILNYTLAQLDSNLILPYQNILSNQHVLEYDSIQSYTINEGSSSGDLTDWVSSPLYNLIKELTSFTIRDLEILYDWKSEQLYALEFIPLRSYDSCDGVISSDRTIYNISKSILAEISCPVALVLSNTVTLVETNSEIENPLNLSVLEIFTRVTGIESWIEIANILELDYSDGIIIDTPRLQEIGRDTGRTKDDIMNKSVPQIIANLISLNDSIYIFKHYPPMFNDLLSTYGFTVNKLHKASGRVLGERTTITELHEWLLTILSSRYDVYNISSLIGYTEHFPDDFDLASLPSFQWPDIIDAVIQQSFKQVMHAFSYDMIDPDVVMIISQPDKFQTIVTTKTSSFNDQYINRIASCLFNKNNDSFTATNFKEYHRFYNNTMAKTIEKKILFETQSLEEILYKFSLSLTDLEDVLLSNTIQMATGFKNFEIQCLYGNSISSLLKSGIKWGTVWDTKLCYSFTNLTLLQIVMAVEDAPTVNCDVDVDECVRQTPCHADATCKNVIGSYECACNAGYVGNGIICSDFDECTRSAFCHSDARCQNTIGSYTCSCKTGFTGNGKKCTALDPGPSSPSASSDSNIGVIIGVVVAAVVVIIIVILIVAWFFYRRKPGKENRQDVGNIKNAAYEGDTQLQRRLPQVPYSDSGYEEPSDYAQLDSFKRVPIDANYQSLIHNKSQSGATGAAGYAVLESGNENERYTSPKNKSDSGDGYVTIMSNTEATKESIYEELP